MSQALGPIHYRMFQKIQEQEGLVQAIITLSEENDWQPLVKDAVDEAYGVIETDDLENIIDLSQIHGWINERVERVEGRYAFVVSQLLAEDPNRFEAIAQKVYEMGQMVKGYENTLTPKEAYTIYDMVCINGMPCDGVNRIAEEGSESLTFLETIPIHDQFWTAVNGNPEHYGQLREYFMAGVLSHTDCMIEKTGDHQYCIRKANINV